MTGLRASACTLISGTSLAHSLTAASTMPASLPGNGETIEPWLSDASRDAVSSFSAGTLGATAESSSVFASRTSVRKPRGSAAGLRARSASVRACLVSSRGSSFSR